MTTAAITHQINHNVFLKLHAIVDRKLGDKHHGLGVVAIDVKNGRLNHLGHFGAIFRRTSIDAFMGGKANLVVDDDVDGAARVEATGL